MELASVKKDDFTPGFWNDTVEACRFSGPFGNARRTNLGSSNSDTRSFVLSVDHRADNHFQQRRAILKRQVFLIFSSMICSH
jgi:hypothetical protein